MFVDFWIFAVSGGRMRVPIEARRESSDDHNGAHVDDIFAVREKTRRDQFGSYLNQMVPVINLGELRWYSG